jgi:predicted transposase YdaD
MLAGILGGKEAKDMTASLAEELIQQGEARGMAKGRVEGRAEGVILVLRTRFNSVPEKIQKRVRTCFNPEQLETWIRLAASCQSLEEFGRNIG